MGFKVRNILVVHNFNCATILTVSTFTTFEKGDLKNISFIHPNFLIIGQSHSESVCVGEADLPCVMLTPHFANLGISKCVIMI